MNKQISLFTGTIHTITHHSFLMWQISPYKTFIMTLVNHSSPLNNCWLFFLLQVGNSYLNHSRYMTNRVVSHSLCLLRRIHRHLLIRLFYICQFRVPCSSNLQLILGDLILHMFISLLNLTIGLWTIIYEFDLNFFFSLYEFDLNFSFSLWVLFDFWHL